MDAEIVHHCRSGRWVRFAALCGMAGLSLLCAASTCSGSTGEIVEPPVNIRPCSAHLDCDPFACIDAGCKSVECAHPLPDDEEAGVPDYLQCEEGKECGDELTCVARDAGTGCALDIDCAPGWVCHRAQCFDVAGRQVCSGDLECGCEQECAAEHSLCLPSGSCALCAQRPELCCGSDQVCDVEVGECIATPTAEPCPAECPPLRICDGFGRCVQCASDDDCNLGTRCNQATGSCVSGQVASCDGGA